MRLSKIYSNKPALFGPIEFQEGLNVVLAEIRQPMNKDKDTHCLGKTTLGRMIDYCFLASRDKNFFLFKHHEIFDEFVFFMEIGLADGAYITVRRGVKEHSKICFKRHNTSKQNFADLPEDGWDHFNIPFERAREILDGLLDWRAVSPWDFRKGLGYQLRGQDDYKDVFQLGRFSIGKHKDWKPYAAHILGFDHKLIEQHYLKLEEVELKKSKAEVVKTELGGSIGELSKFEGLLLLKQNEAERKQGLLDAFDFRQQDKDQTEQLVEEINARLSELNSRRYSLNLARRKIITSLEEDQILFDPDQADRLFKEAGVLFPNQLKKDFTQLIEFNRAITEERRGYLEEERAEIEKELTNIANDIDSLGKQRSTILGYLTNTDVFAKYKSISDNLVDLRADIATLDRQIGFLRRLQELRSEIRALNEECIQLQSLVENNVESQNSDKNSLFSSIRVFFNEIIEEVIANKALLSVSTNKDGHLEFKAEILDTNGRATSADLGHTYRKLLCIAFDLAVLRAHLGKKFPCFVYHDGVFESLDDRKKANLLRVIREYAALGMQPIITLIDSDMPPVSGEDGPVFSQEEVVVTLHDGGDEGRLFRMKAW